MKIKLLLLSLLLSAPAFADNEVGVKLLMANMALEDKDTLTACDIISGIDSTQLKEMNDEMLLSYYPLRSILEERTQDHLAAAASLGKAMEILERRRPTNDYLDIAFGQGYCRKEAGQYKEAGRVLRHALVRGSAIVDSCQVSTSLFTLMAEVNELLGDTLFARLLHEKAQQQSLRIMAFAAGRDSTEIYLSRFNNMFNELHAQQHDYSRERYGYLYGLGQLAYYMNGGGNPKEAIRLSEQALQLARDSMLTDQPWTCYAYSVLLSAYVIDGQKEKAKELLPVACDYFRCFPEMDTTEEDLYFTLGESLFYTGNYEEAWPYLEHMDEVAVRSRRSLDDYRRKLLTVCRALR